jgi:Transposase DDE domain
MDQREVYQWGERVGERLGLGHWQSQMLAGLSFGIIEGRSCTLSTVAEHLGCLGKADSVERRIQRWLNNERIQSEAVQMAWVRWVMRSLGLGPERITLWVDETHLGEHLSIMMVGLAYRQRCIGLTWCCYKPDAWPEGQVGLIERLLKRVQSALPEGLDVLVEADRGLGTSPDLVKAVLALGWHYLFRVQGTTHFQSDTLADCELQQLIRRGAADLRATGHVFKKAHWLPTHICLIWDAPQDEPWCLMSDLPELTGREYGQRNWQEQGFRDLKSGGWRWNASQVWTPDHAERLLLALVLAYALILSIGLRTMADPQLQRNVSRGKRQRWSLFRLGLRVLSDLRRRTEPLHCFLDLSQPVLDFLPSG